MVAIKRVIKSNIKNMLTGTKVHGHIVVLESDDWGSQRMPSAEALAGLQKKGLLVNPCKNDLVDTIARPTDLTALFEVLSAHKDCEGEYAKLTPFFNPANPDFEKIETSDFCKYQYKTFIDILEEEGNGKTAHQLWKESVRKRVTKPQFHGREHLTFPVWMDALKNTDSLTRKCFAYHYYAANETWLPHKSSRFLTSMYFRNEEQKNQIGTAIKDGLTIMETIFGYKPTVFAPPNGVSHPYFDCVMAENGITALHNPKRWEPDGNGGVSQANHREEKNSFGQLFYSRNCVFEPVDVQYDAVDYCLTQVRGAFNWHKAAIISTHRLNYVGGIDIKNRDKGIKELDRLLTAIRKEWKDVRFMTTDEYVKLISKKG